VRICLSLKGLDYETIPIHLVKNGGEQHSQDYESLNPLHQVPTLIHGSNVITQSTAIMEYIEESFPLTGLPLLPSDPLQRAQVRQIVGIIASGIQPIQNLSVLQKIGAEGKMEWGKHWITVGFDALEQVLLNTAGTYCCGDEITIADACLVPQVYNAGRFGVDMDKYKIISRIDEELKKHPSFQWAAPENQVDCPDNNK